MPRIAWLLLLSLFSACSFVHSVQLQNRSTAPVAVTYKIRPAAWKHGMFTRRPVIYRKRGKEVVTDTTVVMDPRDSTIHFSLAPGDEAALAHCMNCTYEGFNDPNAVDAWSADGRTTRMNLLWLRVDHKGITSTYSPTELLALASKSKLQRTVFVVKDR